MPNYIENTRLLSYKIKFICQVGENIQVLYIFRDETKMFNFIEQLPHVLFINYHDLDSANQLEIKTGRYREKSTHL